MTDVDKMTFFSGETGKKVIHYIVSYIYSFENYVFALSLAVTEGEYY